MISQVPFRKGHRGRALRFMALLQEDREQKIGRVAYPGFLSAPDMDTGHTLCGLCLCLSWVGFKGKVQTRALQASVGTQRPPSLLEKGSWVLDSASTWEADAAQGLHRSCFVGGFSTLRPVPSPLLFPNAQEPQENWTKSLWRWLLPGFLLGRGDWRKSGPGCVRNISLLPSPVPNLDWEVRGHVRYRKLSTSLEKGFALLTAAGEQGGSEPHNGGVSVRCILVSPDSCARWETRW